MRGRAHRWSPSWWREPLLVLALGCALAHPARADDAALAAAEATYARGALREGQRAFQALLREPALDRATLARLHVRLGVLAGASGAERTASQHFAIALALEPRLETPAELAGRDRSRFERERRDQPLTLVVAADAPGEVDARVSGAPPGLVASIELSCGGELLARSTPPRAETLRAALAPDRCGPGVIEARARDAHGHVLARAEVRAAGGAEAAP